MDMDTKEIKKTMRRFKSLLLICHLLALISTSVFAQVQYCGSDSTLVSKQTLSNSALFSEEADNAAWTKSVSTITANAIAAPNGASTADRLVEAVGTNVHRYFNATPYNLANDSYRWSAYFKSDQRTWSGIRAYYNGTSYDTYVNLATCTVGTNPAGSTAVATRVLDGWCRLEVTRTTGGVYADGYIIIFTAAGDNINNYAGSITDGIYVWGAQLHLASAPRDYLATTGAAATLGPLCPSGTSQSLNDPSRCFAVSSGNPLKLTPFQGTQGSNNIIYTQPPLTPQRGASN
jgi:hypothetical protein